MPARFKRGGDCQSNDAVAIRRFGSRRCVLRRAFGLLADRIAAGQERLRDQVCSQVDLDPIEMNLSSRDKRAKDVETRCLAAGDDRLGDVPRSAERAPDARRVPASRRQRFSDGVGIDDEGTQAFDNEPFKLSGRQALSGLAIALPLSPDARDQTA